MQWADYRISFHSDKARYHEFDRFIRATSAADARWRVVRKFILPSDAVITAVERLK